MQHPERSHLPLDETAKRDTTADTYQRNKEVICSQMQPKFILPLSFLEPYNGHNAQYREQHEKWLRHEFEKLLKGQGDRS